MDDATKAYAKPLSWSDPDHYPDTSESNPNLDSPTVPEPAGKSESTGEKALDRWFHEQQ